MTKFSLFGDPFGASSSGRQKRRRTESQTPATPSTIVADGGGPSRGEGSNTENGRREEHESGDSNGEDDEVLFSEEDEEGDPEEEGEDDDSDGEEGGGEDDEEELQEQRAEEKRGAPTPDKSLTFTLTDTDVLDCAVCFEPLRSPIFQCENGHVACSSCCVKMANKCRSCTWPIGYNRCRALEKVLESVRLTCKFSNYGCEETINYHKRQDHEKSCPYVPCHCPLVTCSFIGSSKQLARHFSLEHSSNVMTFCFNTSKSVCVWYPMRIHVLLEESADLLFLLTNRIDTLGNKLTISCIGPSFKGEYLYDLVAKHKHSCLKLQTFTRSIQDPRRDPLRSPFLLIPEGFFGKAATINVEILIRDYHTRT